MTCPLMARCSFFNDWLAQKPDLSERYKEVFCKSKHQACARFIVKEATGVVHPTLMPHELERVDEIIRRIRHAQA